ncbi:MAG: CotH kinase family protein [Bacteroidaceae bacterium]|nr:CotH kinase family protein [Bacteroidaceae bacterium]
MKQIIITAILAAAVATGQAQTFAEVLGYGLPVVVVNTVGGEEPTSEAIEHPAGCIGTGITNVVAKAARLQIYRGDTLWYDSGDYAEGESGIKIKHRGNTSAALFENKPFKLKLQKKADLIDSREEGDSTDRRSKDWVLLNSVYSAELQVAFQLSRLVGMEYTPRMQFVNVFINDDYRGMYVLSENITREKEGRVSVDKQDGYIIELNAYFWNEPFSIKSDMVRFMQWTLKYPKAEELTTEQEAHIRSDIQRMEASLLDSNYPQVIDVRSFARWIMVHDIMGTRDSGGCNIYVARTDSEAASLMRMPVVWDMVSSAMTVADEWSGTHCGRGGVNFFPLLFDNVQCMDFTKAFIDEWKRIKEENILDSLVAYIDGYASTPEGIAVRVSAPHHMQRWGYSYGLTNLVPQLAAAKRWIASRKLWIDEQVSAMESAYTGMSSLREQPPARRRKELLPDGHIVIRHDNKTYTIDGLYIGH